MHNWPHDLRLRTGIELSLILTYPPTDTAPSFNPPTAGLWTPGMQGKVCAAQEWRSELPTIPFWWYTASNALHVHNTDGSALLIGSALLKPGGYHQGAVTSATAQTFAMIDACGPNATTDAAARSYRVSVDNPTLPEPTATRIIFVVSQP